eukprot:4403220-Pyramimonas_sp.AAC.1
MAQIRIRLSAAASMLAASCGTSCIAMGPQVVRIFPATPSREQIRGGCGNAQGPDRAHRSHCRGSC